MAKGQVSLVLAPPSRLVVPWVLVDSECFANVSKKLLHQHWQKTREESKLYPIAGNQRSLQPKQALKTAKTPQTLWSTPITTHSVLKSVMKTVALYRHSFSIHDSTPRRLHLSSSTTDRSSPRGRGACSAPETDLLAFELVSSSF